MTPFVCHLRGAGLTSDRGGGKAAALDRLLAGGFPVPPAAVVTTDAYRRFAAHPDITSLVERLVHPPDPDRLEEEQRRVDEAFLAAPVPDDLADVILSAAADVGGGGPVAVRSSATGEDTAEASFAGQYRSHLDVSGDEQILRAVRLTWASLWSPGVRAYREAADAEGDAAMGVILMRMVDADLAGVVFTVDPGGGASDMRIEVARGLADDIVAGTQTPEAIVTPRVPPRSFPDDAAPVLDELVDLALEVEEQLGGPQDIEWAHDDEGVWLVQARPVTALRAEHHDDDGFDTPSTQGSTFTSAGVAEMLPGVLPPLVWSMNAPLLEEAFRHLLDQLGVLPPAADALPVVGRFRGRAALNLSLLRESAVMVPGGSVRELERQYFGRPLSEEPEPEEATTRRRRRRVLPSLVRMLRLRSELTRDVGVLVDAVGMVAGAGARLDELDEEELLAYWRRLLDLGGRLYRTETGVAVTAAAAYRALELFLERHLGDEARGLAQSITTVPRGAVASTGAALEIGRLLDMARAEPELAEVLAADGELSSVVARLRTMEPGRRFLDRMLSVLDRAGSAAMFGGPTWAEHEAGVWSMLRQALESPARSVDAGTADATMREVERRLTSTWRWRLTRVVTGQVVDVRRRGLRRMADDARQLLAAREESKRALLCLGGEVRRVVLRLGELLATRGVLDEPGDVELLSDIELEETLAGVMTVPARQLERRRQALEEAHRSGRLPPVFAGRPGPAVTDAHGPGVRGWGASPGRHRGHPNVVTDLRTAHVRPGEVIVAESTDASWTPLFLRAGAIVVEEGGPLSHAAIVARELGLPAVLNVPGATERLRGVSTVVVDGDAGTVEVIDGDGTPRATGDDADMSGAAA